ncbi:hypothetical protein [Natrinema sp. 1APR25-10V2]|uniref:hypothetical protein n=1 Tax=Natrinema sp. 1APR25-10V2 TaxID=2951081 RepID=UPI00287607B5|nr:hypothetical protein [Natrinema sp. 1APR25-10V2]MDS0474369.1 hypothetical protein [Natrinema sp. 1APR25-10V2]
MAQSESKERLVERSTVTGPVFRVNADIYDGDWDSPESVVKDIVELPDGSTEVRLRVE